MGSATVLAEFRIKAIEAFQDFQGGHVLEPGREADTAHQISDYRHLYAFGSITQESVMPDSDEPVWEHIHEKPPDELSRSQGGSGRGAHFVVFDLGGDGLRGGTKDSGVGDGDVMGVSTQVFNDVGRPFEGFLEMGNPLFRIKCVEKFFELSGILEHDLREGKDQFPLFVQLFQPFEVFSPKKPGYGFDGEMESCLGRDELLVLAESSSSVRWCGCGEDRKGCFPRYGEC